MAEMETKVSQAIFQNVYPGVKINIRWMLAKPEHPILMESTNKVRIYPHTQFIEGLPIEA